MKVMITSYEEYRDLALRSIKPHESWGMALADWTLGLGGETGEFVELLATSRTLDRMEVAKEIGDILWYSTATAEELGIEVDLESVPKEQVGSLFTEAEDKPLLLDLYLTVCSIQEDAKHLVFHKDVDRDEITEKISEKLHKVYRIIRDICIDIDIDIKLCATLNAAKLAHRFALKDGGKYTKEASAMRHNAEVAFEDTATYKRLYNLIETQEEQLEIFPDDLEVL